MVFQDKTIVFYFIFATFCLLFKEIKMQNLQKYKWNRRLLIISEASNGANILQSIKNNYECEMALRNMNVIIIGSTESSDTIFTYDPVNGQPIQHRTENLNQNVAQEMKENLEGKYSNLSGMRSWAILVGYDGYRKNTYQSTDVNDFVPEMFTQIDRMPMRRGEMVEQQRLGISCSQGSFMTSGA